VVFAGSGRTRQGDYQAALSFYERAEYFGLDFVVRARVLNSKARALWYLGQHDAREALWSRVLQAYGYLPLERRELAVEIAKVQVNLAIAKETRGERETALSLYDEVVARWSTATELPLRKQIAGALVNKGYTLGELGR